MHEQNIPLSADSHRAQVNISSAPAWREQLLAEWKCMARSADPIEAHTGRALLDAWKHTRAAEQPSDDERPPAAWGEHLAELTDAPVQLLDAAHYKTGHSQMHRSSSGTCLWVNLDWGRWGCRSCHQGGDVIWWVAYHEGVSRRTAETLLWHQFGAPRAQ